MSYAYRILTEELQKAAARPKKSAGPSTKTMQSLAAEYRVSAPVADYLKRLSDYRERSRHVRVGEY